uniref:Uncharacterized protein n=1 Tax=Daphnia galeata TaxID=27404 RepID=A0A8J2S7T5_9CRUS|nr:unnamed protein product [Daphnia galeata]
MLTNLTLVQTKDYSKATIQLVTRTRPGAFVAVSILRNVNYIIQADNELTPSRSVHGVTWTDREGLKADRTEYLKGANPGADTKRTLDLAGLWLSTDADISQ